MSHPVSVGNTKRAFWTVAMFYMLVAFEFFYMASPFALYFYSVYRPGLDFISSKTDQHVFADPNAFAGQAAQPA